MEGVGDPKPPRKVKTVPGVEDSLFDGQPSRCRSCGAEVWWARMSSGRSMPVNRDKTSHFATCPQAGQWRRGK